MYPVDNIRRRVIDTAYICGKGSHVGSSLSFVDILAVLVKEKLNNYNEVILSKGHGALAWYATLAEYGMIDEELLKTFQQNDSELSVLAVKNRRLKIECSTGSLGQGMSVATGIALAKKKLHESGDVYVVVGNGESNEGIVWEAAMFASQNKLDNLCVIVDHNHFQSDGNSKNIIAMNNMSDLWSSQGFFVEEIDGHKVDDICNALNNQNGYMPRAIICNTVKGYGVDFMENSAQWHHNRLTEEKYKTAVALLEARYDG